MKSKITTPASMTLVAGAVAAALAFSAQAAENRSQRYTAGLGGTDMTTMLTPGWYGQVAAIHYHARKLKDNSGNSVKTLSGGTVAPTTIAGASGQAVAAIPALSGLAAGVPTAVGTALAGQGMGYQTNLTHFRADAYVVLPRITYISGTQFLGAHLGFTAMLPLVERQTSLAGQTSFVDRTSAIQTGLQNAGVPAPNAAAIAAGVSSNIQNNVNTAANANLTSRNGSITGHGDLEFAPVLNWEIGDHQTATLTPTIVLPTGRYEVGSAVNSGFGDFYTFRPSFQYGFIGDGWDVGARAIVSFNTRNKETKYKSGTMFNLDFAAMTFVSDDVRVGFQGYVVQQLTDDHSDVASVQADIQAADGARMRAYALGPALGWIVNGGEMVVEGKALREFGARNRAEGTTFMLMLSKPFGL